MEAISFSIMPAAQQELLEETMKREGPRLLQFIRKRVATLEDAEDLLQDVYYQMMTGIGDIGGVANLSSWLFTVTRNRITDWYRKRKTVPFSRHRDGNGKYAGKQLELIPGDSALPEDEFSRNMLWEAMEEAIGRLPGSQREVFILHEFEGWSFQEIAELTGEPLNTLLSRKHYAVKFLRKELRDMYNDLIR